MRKVVGQIEIAEHIGVRQPQVGIQQDAVRRDADGSLINVRRGGHGWILFLGTTGEADARSSVDRFGDRTPGGPGPVAQARGPK